MSDSRNMICRSHYTGALTTREHDTYNNETGEYLEKIKAFCDGKIGFTCSSFDLFHPGHVIMLADSKSRCDVLVVGLQRDPTLDRPDTKNMPIQTYEERKIMIESCKYVDYVVEYSTENDLYNILMKLKPDTRILGSDWKGKNYTGYDIKDISIYWHDRSGHEYSTTNLRKRIYQEEKRISE